MADHDALPVESQLAARLVARAEGNQQRVQVECSTGAARTQVQPFDRFARTRQRRVTYVVPGGGGDPVTFAEEVIVTRSETGVRAFSARCTHLGCRIDRTEGDLLVCPCHGSRFRLDGAVATGPAVRPLEPLVCELDSDTGDVIVRAS